MGDKSVNQSVITCKEHILSFHGSIHQTYAIWYAMTLNQIFRSVQVQSKSICSQCCVESLSRPFSHIWFILNQNAFWQKICTLNQVSGLKVKFIADLYESLSVVFCSPVCLLQFKPHTALCSSYSTLGACGLKIVQ